AGFFRTPHGQPSRPRRTGTARSAEGVLEAVRQPHLVAADRRPRRLRGVERLEPLPARSGRQGRSALRRDREGGAGGRCRPRDAHLCRYAVALSAGDVHPPGRARRGARRVREGSVRRRPGKPRLGRRPRRRRWPAGDRAAASGRAAARHRQVRRSAQAARRDQEHGVRRARRRPSRRRVARSGQERRRAGRLPQGVDGDGSEDRLPPPDRGQAQPARRPACGDRSERRRGRQVTGARPMRAVRRSRAAIVALLAAAFATGCSNFWNPFGPDRPKPKDLEPIAAPITVREAWRQNFGKVEFPLTVAVNGTTLTMATSDGTVLAFEGETGRTLWRTSVGSAISAGVGSDGTVAAVVTREGNLVALDSARIRWTKPLGVRVATAPLVAGGRIFVLGVDRSVHAFDAADGLKLWQVARPGDALTLQQTGVVTAFKDTLVVGQGP